MADALNALLATALDQYGKTRYELPARMQDRFRADEPFDNLNLSYLLGSIHNKEGYPYLLSLIVRQMKKGLVVELGSRYGVSTVAIASHLSAETTFVAVDIVKDARYIPGAIWAMPNFRFVEDDGLNSARVYELAGLGEQTVDILFSDTEHSYEQLRAEFLAWQPLLSDEALFIVDDINLNDKRRFFEEFEGEKFDLTDQCHSSGFAIMVVKVSRAYAAMPFSERMAKSTRSSLDYYSKKHIEALTPLIKEANLNAEGKTGFGSPSLPQRVVNKLRCIIRA